MKGQLKSQKIKIEWKIWALNKEVLIIIFYFDREIFKLLLLPNCWKTTLIHEMTYKTIEVSHRSETDPSLQFYTYETSDIPKKNGLEKSHE